MSKPVRRLGRGLDSLVSNLRTDLQRFDSTQDSATEPKAKSETPPISSGPANTLLTVESLAPNPLQPRDNVGSANIESLAQSIRQNGLIQPLLVRPAAGRYEIIAGERRWLAAKHLGMTHVPVVVREASDDEMLELALVENLQREDLNAIERANAYRQFCTRLVLKPDEVASRLGEDRTTVINYLRLLDLPANIQRLVADDKLTMGHARSLAGLADDSERSRLANLVIQKELSVRALETLVRRTRAQQTTPPSPKLGMAGRHSPHLADLERRFEQALKTKVRIRPGRGKGRGKIVIEYYSFDDFDRITTLLGVATE